MGRPLLGDYGDFYQNYINLTQGDDPKALINQHAREISDAIQRLPESKGEYAYAPGKWTIKQMIQHLLDTERIFTYRLIWIARGDQRPLPGFDENMFAAAAAAHHRTLQELQEEFISLRNSTDFLIAGLTDQELLKKGEASGYPVTVNALCFMIYGHLLHHLQVLKQRYGV